MFGFAVFAFLALGVWRVHVNRVVGVWTPEKEALYRYGIQHIHDPRRLTQMADHFEKDGFRDRALVFRERAKLVHVSGEAQNNYSHVMRKALASQNPDSIRTVAHRYEKSGRGASAEMLRSYANGLQASREVGAVGQQLGYGNAPGAWAKFGNSTYIPPRMPEAVSETDTHETDPPESAHDEAQSSGDPS